MKNESTKNPCIY